MAAKKGNKGPNAKKKTKKKAEAKVARAHCKLPDSGASSGTKVTYQRTVKLTATKSANFVGAVKETFDTWDTTVGTMETLGSEITDLEAQVTLKRAKLAKADQEYDKQIGFFGGAVETKANGDAGIITDLGMQVTGDAQVVGVLGAPVWKKHEAGDAIGDVLLAWVGLYGASVYLLQMCVGPVKPENWAQVAVQTQTQITHATGHPAGTELWFRVHAIGTKGAGAWSTEIMVAVR